MTEEASPYPMEIVDDPTSITNIGSEKTKGRGPTKSFKVTEPMQLEYNALGQPCGKWRR